MQLIKGLCAALVQVIPCDFVTNARVGGRFSLVLEEISKGEVITSEGRVGDAQFDVQVISTDGNERVIPFSESGSSCDQDKKQS